MSAAVAAHPTTIAPTGLPWSLMVLVLRCEHGGELTLAHDGGETGGAMIRELAVVSDGCTCGRDLDVREIEAIRQTLTYYRAHGAWPAWTTERGGVLTLEMAKCLAAQNGVAARAAAWSLNTAGRPRHAEALELEPWPTDRWDVLGPPDKQEDF